MWYRSVNKFVVGLLVCGGIAYGEVQRQQFVGVSVGGGINSAFLSNNTGQQVQIDSGGGVSVGVLYGGEITLNHGFGFRGYTRFDYYQAIYKASQPGMNTINTFQIGFNADLLYDFINQERVKMGVFAGFGYGWNFYSGSAIDFIYAKIGDTDFAANAGARVVFAQRHGVEFVARVPILLNTIMRDIYNTTKIQDRRINFSLRYTFYF